MGRQHHHACQVGPGCKGGNRTRDLRGMNPASCRCSTLRLNGARSRLGRMDSATHHTTERNGHGRTAVHCQGLFWRRIQHQRRSTRHGFPLAGIHTKNRSRCHPCGLPRNADKRASRASGTFTGDAWTYNATLNRSGALTPQPRFCCHRADGLPASVRRRAARRSLRNPDRDACGDPLRVARCQNVARQIRQRPCRVPVRCPWAWGGRPIRTIPGALPLSATAWRSESCFHASTATRLRGDTRKTALLLTALLIFE